MLAVMPSSQQWNAIDVVVKGVETGNSQWIALDDALTAPHFRNLKRFSLVNRRNYMDPFRDEIKALMPLATARGILSSLL
jgi:hypothetical protein